MIRITADSLSKSFNRRKIFENISFSFSSPYCLGITGKNGAGKSTLIKIVAGLLEPDSGRLLIENEGKIILSEKIISKTGFVAPYLNLYDEFTAIENLAIFDEIRGAKKQLSFYKDLLNRVSLFERRNDFVRTFSSGMKQRLKIAFALSNNPDILLLDEPTSNLDSSGIEMVHEIMIEHKKNGILIVASNDKNDFSLFDDNIILN